MEVIGSIISKLNLLTSRIQNYYLLILITFVGALLRFYKLGAQSFWIDEVYSITFTRPGYYDLGNPPLSYMILRIFLETFGTNEFTTRLPSCFFGIATIPLVYLLGKQLFGDKEGIIAASIISLSPWHIQWSQTARMYTQLTVFTLLTFYFIYQAINKENVTSYILSAIFMTLAFYTHYSGVLIAGIIALWIIFKSFFKDKSNNVNLKYMLIFFGVCSILCLPYFFVNILYLTEIKLGGSETRWGVPSVTYFVFHLFSFRLSPIFSVLVILGAFLMMLKRNTSSILLILYAVVPLIAFSLLISWMNIALRYLVFTLPAYALLSSYLLVEIAEKLKESKIDKEIQVKFLKSVQINKLLSIGFLLGILLGMLNLPSLYLYYSYGVHPDWRSACSFVKSRLKPEDVVVSRHDITVEYYLGRCDYKLSAENFDEIRTSNSRVWLLMREGTVVKIDPNYEIRNWLESDCEMMKEVYLITVYLYTPQNK